MAPPLPINLREGSTLVVCEWEVGWGAHLYGFGKTQVACVLWDKTTNVPVVFCFPRNILLAKETRTSDQTMLTMSLPPAIIRVNYILKVHSMYMYSYENTLVAKCNGQGKDFLDKLWQLLQKRFGNDGLKASYAAPAHWNEKMKVERNVVGTPSQVVQELY